MGLIVALPPTGVGPVIGRCGKGFPGTLPWTRVAPVTGKYGNRTSRTLTKLPSTVFSRPGPWGADPSVKTVSRGIDKVAPVVAGLGAVNRDTTQEIHHAGCNGLILLGI